MTQKLTAAKQLGDGLGYVTDTPLSGPNLTVISVFHQLHCLVNCVHCFLRATLTKDCTSIPCGAHTFQTQQAAKTLTLDWIVATIPLIALSICGRASSARLTRHLSLLKTGERASWAGASRDHVATLRSLRIGRKNGKHLKCMDS